MIICGHPGTLDSSVSKVGGKEGRKFEAKNGIRRKVASSGELKVGRDRKAKVGVRREAAKLHSCVAASRMHVPATIQK